MAALLAGSGHWLVPTAEWLDQEAEEGSPIYELMVAATDHGALAGTIAGITRLA
jgi:hypothetical protein